MQYQMICPHCRQKVEILNDTTISLRKPRDEGKPLVSINVNGPSEVCPMCRGTDWKREGGCKTCANPACGWGNCG